MFNVTKVAGRMAVSEIYGGPTSMPGLKRDISNELKLDITKKL